MLIVKYCHPNICGQKFVFQFKDYKLVFFENFIDILACLQPHRGDIFVAPGEKK
jgi:hypothetical protein